MKIPAGLKNKKIWLAAGSACLVAAMVFFPRAREKLSADFVNAYNYTNYYGAPSGQIFQAGMMAPAGSSCMQSLMLSWSAQNVSAAEVTVSDMYSGSRTFATLNLNSSASGSYIAPRQNQNGQQQNLMHSGPQSWNASGLVWLVPGDNYSFTLWNTSNGRQTSLAQTAINAPGFGCNGQTQANNFNGNGANTPAGPSNSGSMEANFTLSSNNNFCVGQVPSYTVTAPSGQGGQTIDWTSAHNGSTDNQTTFTLNSSGSWSASGNAWGSSDVGSWEKTATINGVSQSLNFNVQDCGNTNNNSNNFNNFSGSPSGSATSSGNAGSSANSGAQTNFSLSSNNNFCVGQVPIYTITSSFPMANENFNWTSSHNGASTQSGFELVPSGSWSASGNAWGSGDTGSWEKTATINGISQSLNFNVQDCSGGNTGTTGNSSGANGL